MKIFFICVLQFVLSITTIISAQTPGELSSNAKTLDVDELFNYQDGVAIVKKGESYALIDENGEIIIPFNKYKSIKHGQAGSSILIASKKQPPYGNYLLGLINSKGMELSEFKYHEPFIGSFDKDGFAILYPPTMKDKTLFINSAGMKYRMAINEYTVKQKECSESLCVIEKLSKFGFADRTGKVVISAQFDFADVFSEGLCCVGKINEFGKMKYGFINKQGVVVIPFQFSNLPTAFTSGLALVSPEKKDEFNYAYINKEGEVLYKLKKAPNGDEIALPFGSNGKFVNGYSEWTTRGTANGEYYLMDSLGIFIRQKKYFSSLGIDTTKFRSNINLWRAKGKIIQITDPAKGSAGYINMRTGKVLLNNLKLLIPNQFDSNSKLVLASIYDSKIGKRIAEGYVNEDGIFIIVKGQGDKW